MNRFFKTIFLMSFVLLFIWSIATYQTVLVIVVLTLLLIALYTFCDAIIDIFEDYWS